MNTNSIIPKNSQEVSTVVRVDKRSEDRWNIVKDKASRNGQMMLFDTYRISLGGADAGWGTKVFKQSIINIGFVETCDSSRGQKGTFCPTDKALEKYGHLFYYDPETNLWGLNNMNISEFDEKILPALVVMATEVRKQHKEAAKRRAQARYIEKRKSNKTPSIF